MKIEIVRISAQNVSVLDQVAEDVFDAPIDPGRVARLVDDRSHIMLVALSHHVVIGQALAVVHRHPDKPTELYINDLATSPTHQRRGIATRLVMEAMTIGSAEGCNEVWIATEQENDAANTFYELLGLERREAFIFEREIHQ